MYNELYHHGVKGMKWGVRRTPEQLGHRRSRASSTTSVRNRTLEKSIAAGKVRVNNLEDYTVGSLTTFVNSGREYVSGLVNGHDFDWQEVSYYSDGYGKTQNDYVSPIKQALYNKEQNGTYGKFGFAKSDGIYERSLNHGRVDDFSLQKCNPEFGSAGTTQNCAKCSATLELAGRGFNFMAGRQSYPSTADAMTHWFKGAKRMEMDTDSSEEIIKSFGNKTSGTIQFRYPDHIGGGHAMHWTVDDTGTFEIQDGQNSKRHSSVSEMLDYYGADKSKGVGVFRLDNCEPDWDNLISDSVVRDPSGTNQNNKVRNKFSSQVVDRW